MRYFLIVLLLITTSSILAQVSHHFRNTPLTEALRTIEQSQSDYSVAILSDGLNDLRSPATPCPSTSGIALSNTPPSTIRLVMPKN
ncbi:MAG: hypothetical protein K6G32_12215 [Prevotella sp.]|nr:hypothetical protein [Prevotella sp.]